jgi:hypothetical protein
MNHYRENDMYLLYFYVASKRRSPSPLPAEKESGQKKTNLPQEEPGTRKGILKTATDGRDGNQEK